MLVMSSCLLRGFNLVPTKFIFVIYSLFKVRNRMANNLEFGFHISFIITLTELMMYPESCLFHTFAA